MAVVATGAFALISACSFPPSATSTSTPTSDNARPAMTLAQLCDEVVDFFRDELHVVDSRWFSPFRPESSVELTGDCSIAQRGNQIARWESRDAPDDPDPTEGGEDFEKSTMFDHPVWILQYDEERWIEPGHAVLYVTDQRLATRVGTWNARLMIVHHEEIQTTEGTLAVNEENTRKLGQFLIALTRRLSAT